MPLPSASVATAIASDAIIATTVAATTIVATAGTGKRTRGVPNDGRPARGVVCQVVWAAHGPTYIHQAWHRAYHRFQLELKVQQGGSPVPGMPYHVVGCEIVYGYFEKDKETPEAAQ